MATAIYRNCETACDEIIMRVNCERDEKHGWKTMILPPLGHRYRFVRWQTWFRIQGDKVNHRSLLDECWHDPSLVEYWKTKVSLHQTTQTVIELTVL